MFSTILNSIKVTNWDKIQEVKGVIFDTYSFKDVPEVCDAQTGYGAKGYACSCGTTFISHYAVCPHCGNREFLGEDLWTAYIHDEVCNIATYRYFLNRNANGFVIDKSNCIVSDFAESKIDYRKVYSKHPELMNIAKYKAMWDVAEYMNNHVETATWWTTHRLLTRIYEAVGNYDVTLAKQFTDMFEYQSQLTGFLGSPNAIQILSFLKFKKYDNELIKRTNIHDLSYHHEDVDQLPDEVIKAALRGRHHNMFGSLSTMSDVLKKYKNDPRSIEMACYFLENMTLKTPCKSEMAIFMEWAMNTTEEVTMEKFYWYLNAKYIQRSGMNDKFEKIIANFDNDPVTALIKLTKS